MNNNYYPNYQTQAGYPNQEFAPTAGNTFLNEQSYVENILRLNKGNFIVLFLILTNGEIQYLQEL